jgi:hypothetical protein
MLQGELCHSILFFKHHGYQHLKIIHPMDSHRQLLEVKAQTISPTRDWARIPPIYAYLIAMVITGITYNVNLIIVQKSLIELDCVK